MSEQRAGKFDNLKIRTKAFALAVIHFVERLPRDQTSSILGKQLLRAGSSVGANYRAACRARSAAEFISKLGVVEEESDECIYWLELLVESKKTTQENAMPLIQEADELLAITVSSIQTARGNNRKPQISQPRTPKLNSAFRTSHSAFP